MTHSHRSKALARLAGALLSLTSVTAAMPVTLAAAEDAAAAEPEKTAVVTAGAGVGLTSAYVWRGFVETDDWCVQPTFWVRLGPLTATSWMNVHPGAAGTQLTEHDLTLEYARSLGKLDLVAGWTNYALLHPDTGQSNEFYAGVTVPVPLSPSLRVFRDVQQGNGTYWLATLSQAVTWGGRLSTTLTGTVGYNDHQWTERSGWSDATATVAIDIPRLARAAGVEPFVTYSRGLESGVPSRVFAGISVKTPE